MIDGSGNVSAPTPIAGVDFSCAPSPEAAAALLDTARIAEAGVTDADGGVSRFDASVRDADGGAPVVVGHALVRCETLFARQRRAHARLRARTDQKRPPIVTSA